jgi:hypothetical protein
MYEYRNTDARSRVTVVLGEQYILHICVFVCVCTRARVPGHVGVCTLVRACSLVYPAYNSYAPYRDVICVPFGSTIFFDINP